MKDTDRFPIEIVEVLDALGEADNRQMFARLVDGDVFEGGLSESEYEALDTLRRAGLANKQIHDESDGGIVGVYRLSEFGERWMEDAFSTMGSIETPDGLGTETSQGGDADE